MNGYIYGYRDKYKYQYRYKLGHGHEHKHKHKHKSHGYNFSRFLKFTRVVLALGSLNRFTNGKQKPINQSVTRHACRGQRKTSMFTDTKFRFFLRYLAVRSPTAGTKQPFGSPRSSSIRKDQGSQRRVPQKSFYGTGRCETMFETWTLAGAGAGAKSGRRTEVVEER